MTRSALLLVLLLFAPAVAYTWFADVPMEERCIPFRYENEARILRVLNQDFSNIRYRIDPRLQVIIAKGQSADLDALARNVKKLDTPTVTIVWGVTQVRVDRELFEQTQLFWGPECPAGGCFPNPKTASPCYRDIQELWRLEKHGHARVTKTKSRRVFEDEPASFRFKPATDLTVKGVRRTYGSRMIVDIAMKSSTYEEKTAFFLDLTMPILIKPDPLNEGAEIDLLVVTSTIEPL